MVKLIAGRRGSGKTKLLIDAIHKAKANSKGNVVAVQIGNSLNSEVNHSVRLINIEDYKIGDATSMFGFVGGIMASDYDCTDIFIDGILRIVGRELDEVEKMLDKIEAVSGNTNVTFTISADLVSLPDNIKKFAVNI